MLCIYKDIIFLQFHKNSQKAFPKNEWKYVTFCIFDNFQHLASIEHNWKLKRYLYTNLDKIYIIYQYLFGIWVCSSESSHKI